MPNKPDIGEYKNWLKEKHKVEITDRSKAYYESVTNKIKNEFEKSDIWTKLLKNLREYNDEYHVERGYQLLMSDITPEISIKPFNSFFIKTFRKNIIENKYYPEPPEKGWIIPNEWYSRIGDIIRTTIVVKYLDGVEFIANKIKLLCEQNELDSKIFWEATEEGHYAAHLYIKKQFEIQGIEWDTQKIDISIEIQVTTQLQDVIQRLLHKYYEEKRKNIVKEDVKWQWNYKSDEFAANYLGHILHYIEGMIIEIRNKQKEEEKK